MSSTGSTLLVLAGVAIAGVVIYNAVANQGPQSPGSCGGSLGARAGCGIVNEVNDALSAAANSVWNGSGTGPLDSWDNLFNFLSGNCPNGNCAGS
jgi:hypothetical protein